MSDQPTLYLSNWSSRATPGHHGPGRKLSIMSMPRHWEHGDGRVWDLVPLSEYVRRAKADPSWMPEYRARYVEGLMPGFLRPGQLGAELVMHDGPALGFRDVDVADGDTLCCACSRAAAARGECHRVWAAAALKAAGWRVVLDGVVL